jgi:hypothetical protein
LLVLALIVIWKILKPFLTGIRSGINEARSNFWKWMLKKAREHEKRK